MRRQLGLLQNERGSTVTEFAIVAPVMCLFMVGAFDTAHSLYARSVLQGVVQKTARDATLEASTNTAAQAVQDAKVRAQVKALANNATIEITRRYYRTFSAAAAAQAEIWTDNNDNDTCDGPVGATPGEPYQDVNNNGVWDSDGGDAGQGGAKDRTVYKVKVSYPRLFPLWKYIGASSTTEFTATTVLMNQPYSDQGSYSTATPRNCT